MFENGDLGDEPEPEGFGPLVMGLAIASIAALAIGFALGGCASQCVDAYPGDCTQRRATAAAFLLGRPPAPMPMLAPIPQTYDPATTTPHLSPALTCSPTGAGGFICM